MSYKVVKIVNEYLVVVDYGYKDNAMVDDILEIYQTGVAVEDPATLEHLGTLDVTKANIKVIKVYEKMSLCKSNDWIANKKGTINSFSQTLGYLTEAFASTEVKPLKVNTMQITGGYDSEELTISLEDPVKIVKSQYIDDVSEDEEFIDIKEFE